VNTKSVNTKAYKSHVTRWQTVSLLTGEEKPQIGEALLEALLAAGADPDLQVFMAFALS
jgi:hypothetical protein